MNMCVCTYIFIAFVVCTFVDPCMFVCIQIHIYLQYIHISFLGVLSSELGTKVAVDGILALLQAHSPTLITRNEVGVAIIMKIGTK